MQFALFTDNLASLSLADVCQATRKAGFDGLDLTLRPGGHVLPEKAEMGMAEARQLADAAGLALCMVTTGVTDTSSPHAEEVFASAAHYGVRRLKLGYWHYQPFGSAAKQIDAAQASLGRLVELGKKYNVLPCVHVHSGRIIASGGSQVYLLLRDFKPGEAGAYVDPMHMTIEGGLAGWEIGLDLLAPWLALVGMKNFRWLDSADGRPPKVQHTPLHEGHVAMPQFVKYLKDFKYDGVVSLHSEYTGERSFRNLTTADLLEQSAADLVYLKKLFAA